MDKIKDVKIVVDNNYFKNDQFLKQIGIDNIEHFFKTEIATKQIQDIFAPVLKSV